MDNAQAARLRAGNEGVYVQQIPPLGVAVRKGIDFGGVCRTNREVRTLGSKEVDEASMGRAVIIVGECEDRKSVV